jgi:hypothetical protein
MLITLCASFLCSVSLQSQQTSSRSPDLPVPFAYELALAPGERLLRYAWDGGDPVPFLSEERRPFIVPGELGLSPDARLYLPGNALDECVSSGARSVTSRNLVFVAGRYGQALGFGRSSLLRLALPPQAYGKDGWTLSFWLRPESGAFGRLLVLLPGAVEVVLLGDGRLRARLLPNDQTLTHASILRPGEWEFVLVSYDPLHTRQMRMCVGGSAANVLFPVATAPRIASELLAGDVAQSGQGFEGALDELMLVPLPASTDQARRAAQRALAPGNHTLEIVTSRETRTVEVAAHPTRELVLDTPAELALGEMNGTAIENGVLRWVPARWHEIRTPGAPAPRTTHPTVYIGSRRVLTFGGETRDTHLGPMRNTRDTWIFDGAARRWECVPTALAPEPRCHVPAAYSPDHDLVLLVGGWRNDMVPGSNYDDTWVYRVSQRRWEKRAPGGDAVGRGSDYGMVYLPALRRFLLLRNNHNLLYDPVADRWQRLPPPAAFTESGSPTTYSAGASHMCGLDPATGLVVVFGGAHGPQSLTFSDETALYDVLTNTFTVLAPPVHPTERVRSGFAHDSRRGRFVLFGGVKDQYSLRHDDLWVFDPRTRAWSELACSNRPSPRGGFYGMAYDPLADEFTLFGGRNSPERWLDETWVLEFGGKRSGTALYTFDRLEEHGRRSWFADVGTPGGSSVSFLFRASTSGADWTGWSTASGRFADQRFLQVVAFLKPGPGGAVPTIRRMGLR